MTEDLHKPRQGRPPCSGLLDKSLGVQDSYASGLVLAGDRSDHRQRQEKVIRQLLSRASVSSGPRFARCADSEEVQLHDRQHDADVTLCSGMCSFICSNLYVCLLAVGSQPTHPCRPSRCWSMQTASPHQQRAQHGHGRMKGLPVPPLLYLLPYCFGDPSSKCPICLTCIHSIPLCVYMEAISLPVCLSE